MNEREESGPARQSSYDRATAADSRRRRILVSAYLFSPVMGAEQGVGWNICSRLSAYHDVTVLTRSWNEELWAGDEKHRGDAERFMQDRGPIPGLTIQFVDSPPLSRLLTPHPRCHGVYSRIRKSACDRHSTSRATPPGSEKPTARPSGCIANCPLT